MDSIDRNRDGGGAGHRGTGCGSAGAGAGAEALTLNPSPSGLLVWCLDGNNFFQLLAMTATEEVSFPLSVENMASAKHPEGYLTCGYGARSGAIIRVS